MAKAAKLSKGQAAAIASKVFQPETAPQLKPVQKMGVPLAKAPAVPKIGRGSALTPNQARGAMASGYPKRKA